MCQLHLAFAITQVNQEIEYAYNQIITKKMKTKGAVAILDEHRPLSSLHNTHISKRFSRSNAFKKGMMCKKQTLLRLDLGFTMKIMWSNPKQCRRQGTVYEGQTYDFIQELKIA